MYILARYEPASKTGMYNWDYKLDENYPTLNKLNRYLIELEDLKNFIGKYHKHYYVVAPLWGWNKIQRKLKEKEFLKDNWSKIDFYKVREEQKPEYKTLEDRTTYYFAKELTNISNFEFINKSYWEWHKLYIFSLDHEVDLNEINNIFSQISYLNGSNTIFDFLASKNIGFINLEMSFFHEEYSHAGMREGKGEKILIYYCPWKLKE